VNKWFADRQQSAGHVLKNTILGYKDPEILWPKFSQSWILVLVKRSTVTTGWLDKWTACLAGMKDLVHCICLVVFSDDQRRHFAKKLSLLDVISVPNDSLRNGG
jgi:hypothetical protein